MKIWAWGANTNGQLGLPYTCDQVETPQCLNLPSELVAAAIEHSTSAVVPIKITAGPNEALLLVKQEESEDKSPRVVNVNVEDNVKITSQFHIVCSPKVKDIACGWEFSLVVGQSGKLELFGNGRNNKNFELDSSGGNVVLSQISAGMRHAIAIVVDEGEDENSKCRRLVAVCGDNSKGQLGLPIKIKKTKALESLLTTVEIPGGNDASSKITMVRCGKEFSLVLDSNGDLFGAGSNKFGVLLTSPKGENANTKGLVFEGFQRIAKKTDFPGEIKDIQCGWTHVLVLLQNGRVFSWGRKDFGQLGRRSKSNHQYDEASYDISPGEVTFPEETRIIAIACGTEHNLALGHSGKVYSWGWNEHSNCGVQMMKADEPVNSRNKDEVILENILFPTEVKFPSENGDAFKKITVIGAGAGSSFAVSC